MDKKEERFQKQLAKKRDAIAQLTREVEQMQKRNDANIKKADSLLDRIRRSKQRRVDA